MIINFNIGKPEGGGSSGETGDGVKIILIYEMQPEERKKIYNDIKINGNYNKYIIAIKPRNSPDYIFSYRTDAAGENISFYFLYDNYSQNLPLIVLSKDGSVNTFASLAWNSSIIDMKYKTVFLFGYLSNDLNTERQLTANYSGYESGWGLYDNPEKADYRGVTFVFCGSVSFNYNVYTIYSPVTIFKQRDTWYMDLLFKNTEYIFEILSNISSQVTLKFIGNSLSD